MPAPHCFDYVALYYGLLTPLFIQALWCDFVVPPIRGDIFFPNS